MAKQNQNLWRRATPMDERPYKIGALILEQEAIGPKVSSRHTVSVFSIPVK